MFLWVLRLLYTSKEDLQCTEKERPPGELASLPEGMAPIYDPLPPSVPPRMRTLEREREGHARTVSDVSYASTSSYGSQITGINMKLMPFGWALNRNSYSMTSLSFSLSYSILLSKNQLFILLIDRLCVCVFVSSCFATKDRKSCCYS